MSDEPRPVQAPAPETSPDTSPDPARVPASRPPPVQGTLESVLYAQDLDAAEDFWTRVMGLAAFQRQPGRHVFFRVADGPPVQVLLVFNPDATSTPPAPDVPLPVPPHGAHGPGHYCLAVSAARLDDWRSHLTALGIPIEAEIEWPRGGRSIYLRDPAGNSVELADPALWS
ncbi:glyoxalase/bleomycin resistance/extradiol dioxygenase family protein [Paracoccus suum]|uniref:Glyoxalase/bleomycin resistance/extradiol dioxygenase family protein n=1 Tax=Paracoccus suum TaxID=2259340 RepID=A0A344PKQ7_9RHOB|nr:VOC family protein [Paracoccus suum]AXC49962.1 glyoxalase/bleomycin resistance/extradiol dioxygenase family protein [Paracoccus suum]